MQLEPARRVDSSGLFGSSFACLNVTAGAQLRNDACTSENSEGGFPTVEPSLRVR